MPPVNHALLGASKAHQWLACPPSAKWEEKFVNPGPSEAAQEGTVAHELAEHHLSRMLTGKRVITPKSIKENPLYKPAMEEHVATYCDTVLETLQQMADGGADPSIFLEQKLDLTPWIPEGFGTADCVLVGNKTLHVFDFKYGKGVPVFAEENPQLKLYALGAINEFECLYDITEAVLHIVQPRLGSITEWSVSREVLEKWGEFIVKPTAKDAFEGKGEFNPGEEQCRWCLCKIACRSYNNYMLDACKARFDDQGEERPANELSDKEIADLLGVVDEIKRWVTSVSEYALDQALNHDVQYPGYKLVEGTSRRKITDEKAVAEKLQLRGFTVDQIMKLKGITDLEDEIGKTRLADIVGDYIIKPPGKPTLAPESDKRKPFNSVKFEEVKE